MKLKTTQFGLKNALIFHIHTVQIAFEQLTLCTFRGRPH